MTVETLFPLGFAANTYFVTGGSGTIVIDPAQPRAAIAARERRHGVKYVLLTHAHYDHVGGCAALKAAGAKIYCLGEEKGGVEAYNAAVHRAGGLDEVSVDGYLADGDVLHLCGLEVRVLATPGHTAGSCCFLVKDGAEEALFSGDTLFKGDIGNTDDPVHGWERLERSLEKLSKLANYTVYPGHGMPTTIDEEKSHGILPA